ncbi:MAG: hypothetical protein WD178_05150 [Actinomycetota bacterium]
MTAGSLSITAPTASANLGTTVNSVGGSTITGALGEVVVEDARDAGAGAGWIASAISTAFTPTTGTAIAASLVGYEAGTIDKVGTATYAADDPTHLEAVIPVVTATGITGVNSATWTPSIDIRVPGGASVSSYTATITHSVL